MMRVGHSVFAAAAKNLALSQSCIYFKGRVLCALRRIEAAIAGNFGPALSVTLVVSLLATSSPTAASTLVALAGESERVAVSRLRNSAVLSGLRRGLAYGSARYWSLADKLASRKTSKLEKEKGPQPTGVAAFISPAPLVIDAPTNMTVTSTANTSISLSWTAPSGTVNNYQVERSQNPSGPFSTIGTPTATTFTDTTVTIPSKRSPTLVVLQKPTAIALVIW